MNCFWSTVVALIPLGILGSDVQEVQPKAQPQAKLPTPTYANVAYGPQERNVLDFWQAKSERSTTARSNKNHHRCRSIRKT